MKINALLKNGCLSLWTSINREGLRLRLDEIPGGRIEVTREVWSNGERVNREVLLSTLSLAQALDCFKRHYPSMRILTGSQLAWKD